MLTAINQLALVAVFAATLSLTFLDHDFFALAWVAFVPLLIAVDSISVIRTYALGLLAGFVLFALGSYWVADFVSLSKGFTGLTSVALAGASWIYSAHLIAFILLAYRWLKEHSKLHEFVLFPAVFVGFTAWFPMLFLFQIGETQVKFTIALQGLDLVGVAGLNALIALSNVVFFRLCKSRFRKRTLLWRDRATSIPFFVPFLVLALWFVYGAIQLNNWEQESSGWSTVKVGLVQPNESPRLGKRSTYSGYGDAYPPEMDMTERLRHSGAEVIVWPEGQAKNYLNHSGVRTAYLRNVTKLGVDLIFQDTQRTKDKSTGRIVAQHNSAVMINSAGQESGVYRKMKLIPFGEYIPFIERDSFFRPWAEDVIGEFLSEISAGESNTVFVTEKVTMLPLICYETTFSRFVANAVNKQVLQQRTAKPGVLLGMSNDGWFGDTHQPFIHIMGSVLRSVENRLPLVHVANNGPSIVVSPSGKVLFRTAFRQSGGYIFDVPFNFENAGTFYTRHPYLIEVMVFVILLLSLMKGAISRVTARSFAR